jgi:hypothetical protein
LLLIVVLYRLPLFSLRKWAAQGPLSSPWYRKKEKEEVVVKGLAI